MNIISVIGDKEVIKKILKRLGLWDQKAMPPPDANVLQTGQEYYFDYTDFKLSLSDNWLYVAPQYSESFTANS